jgi:hypothetical protein
MQEKPKHYEVEISVVFRRSNSIATADHDERDGWSAKRYEPVMASEG